MNATRLKLAIDWSPSSPATVPFSTTPPRPGVLRTITRETCAFRCPECHSIVYSRRHAQCGACNATLPSAYRFEPTEAERIDSMLRREQARHRAWMRKIGH